MSGADPRADGRRRAARWQIERTRRPAGPELVWLGYAKPEVATFVCIACGDGGYKQGVVRARGRTFHICAACGTHQAHPPAPAPPPDAFARRVAIEHDAGIRDAARTAARATAGRDGGRLLDLGCRLGFVVDIVRALPGWQAGGVDPGALAAAGSAGLGAPVRQGGPPQAAAEAAVPAHVVLCEDVLDRAADPLATLRALPALSVPRAAWLVAVRDAASLYELDDAASILDLLGPDRLVVFSEPGLRLLLSRTASTEFATAPVRHDGGILRVAVGAPAGAGGDVEAVLSTYFASRLATPAPDPRFDIALRVAALEHAVAQRRQGAARALLDSIGPALRASMEAARGRSARMSLESLFESAPVCAGTLLLQAGLLQAGLLQAGLLQAGLLQAGLQAGLAAAPEDGSRQRAREYLELAAGLCQRAVTLAPSVMRAEAALAERARQALEAIAAGRAIAA